MADMTKVITSAIREATGPDPDIETPDGGVEPSDEGETETPETESEGTEGTEGAEGDDQTAGGAKGAQDGEKGAQGTLKAEDEAFLKEHGLQVPIAGQKINRIPYPRVVKIVENAQRKLAEAVLGGPVPTGKPLIEAVKAHVARLPELETKVKQYEGELENVARAEQIMVQDPKRFLLILPTINPEYAELLKGTGGVPAAAPVPNAEMPDPDYDLGNGQKTYSPDGIKKLMGWVAGQARQQVLSEVDQRFKPVMTEFESQQRVREALPRVQAKVDHARAHWPGFKENEPAILAVLQADQKISFEDAYAKVVNDTHTAALEAGKTNRETMRQELIKELKAKPMGTAATGTTKAPVKTGEPVVPGESATATVIRRSIREAGLKG